MIKYFLYLTVSFLLASCTGEVSFEGQPVNQFGGAGRTNSYEEWGKFYRFTIFIDEFRDIPDTSGAITSPLLLSSDKMAVANASGAVVCLQNRTFDWLVKLDGGDAAAAQMCADPMQNIYVIGSSGKLYSISPGGKIRWKKSIIDTMPRFALFSNLLAQKDGILCAVNNGTFKKYDFKGKELWSKKYELSPADMFAASESGKIILPLSHNEFGKSDTVVCLMPDGNELWKSGIPGTRLIGNPAVYKNRIYIPGFKNIKGNKLNSIVVLDTNGKILKEIGIAITPRHISLTKNEDLLAGGYNAGVGREMSGVFCYDKDFNLKWKLFFEAAIASPLMIGTDRIAFFGQQEDASGMFYMRKDGVYESQVSMSQAPMITLPPVYNPNGAVLFAGKNKMEIIRIDDSDFNKLIPW